MRLGGVAVDEAVKWDRLWAEEEVSKAINVTSSAALDLADQLESDSDATQYESYYKAFEDKALKNRPKGTAGRMYDLWWRQHQPSFSRSVSDAAKLSLTIAVEDKARDQLDKSITSGNSANIKKHLMSCRHQEDFDRRSKDPGKSRFPINTTIERLRQAAAVDPERSIIELKALLTRSDVGQSRLIASTLL